MTHPGFKLSSDPPWPPVKSKAYVDAVVEWLKTRPIEGPNANWLTPERPGILAFRQVQGLKNTRFVMMIPNFVGAYVAYPVMLLSRFALTPDYYAAYGATSRAFLDHNASLATGSLEDKPVDVAGCGVRVNLSIDYDSFDISVQLEQRVALICGWLRSLHKNGLALPKALGLSFMERILAPEALYTNASFANQGGTFPDGVLKWGDCILHHLNILLSGRNDTSLMGTSINHGVMNFILSSMVSFSCADIREAIMEFAGIDADLETIGMWLRKWGTARVILAKKQGDDSLVQLEDPRRS